MATQQLLVFSDFNNKKKQLCILLLYFMAVVPFEMLHTRPLKAFVHLIFTYIYPPPNNLLSLPCQLLFLSNSSFPIIYLLTSTSYIFLALQDKICSPLWVLLADSNVLLSSMNCQSTSSHPAPFLSWPFHGNCIKNMCLHRVTYTVPWLRFWVCFSAQNLIKSDRFFFYII